MMISPADYVIRELGGLTKTAASLGLAVSTVQGWKNRGRVPQDRWQYVIDAAERAGKTLDIHDFLKEHDVEEAA